MWLIENGARVLWPYRWGAAVVSGTVAVVLIPSGEIFIFGGSPSIADEPIKGLVIALSLLLWAAAWNSFLFEPSHGLLRKRPQIKQPAKLLLAGCRFSFVLIIVWFFAASLVAIVVVITHRTGVQKKLQLARTI